VELSSEQRENLKGVLAELSALEGITRCFLAGQDGIIVVSMGQTGNNEALAKQALEIFQSTDRSVSQLKQGSLQQVSVTAESGNILLVGVRQFILVVAAESRVNLGILRLSLDLALKKLAKIL
jgi:predicted regulator of Ras-like GTPase activity (Roadblock/LC7/MglB family)